MNKLKPLLLLQFNALFGATSELLGTRRCFLLLASSSTRRASCSIRSSRVESYGRVTSSDGGEVYFSEFCSWHPASKGFWPMSLLN